MLSAQPDLLPSVAERRAVLDADFPVWTPLTAHGSLDQAALRYGNRPFLITDERSWSYSELAAWSMRLAAGLQELGVGPGDNVALIMGNYPEFIALKFAISRVGAVAVPINTLNRRDELSYLLRHSDASLLVTMDCFRGNNYLEALDKIAPGWTDSGGGEALPALRQVIVFGTGEQPRRAGAAGFETLAGGSSLSDVPDVAPHDLCDIIYTSGTTGPPKGVMLTHDKLTRTAFGAAYGRAFEPGRRIVFALPMFHVFGYLEGMLAVSWVGGAIIPRIRFDAADMLNAIERHRATDSLLIPAMSLALIDEGQGGAYDLSSLNYALASGGRAPERLWRALRDVLGISEITTGYGMTETTASATVTSPDDPLEKLMLTNGRPRDVGPAGDQALGGRLVVYEVRDPSTGHQLPDGEVGELVAQGPGVTAGYYKMPDATNAAFTDDGWLRTGDLGAIDSDGYVHLAGRLKESYRCGGEQVLPSEVEDVLTTHSDVLQAHIVPIPDERMGEVGFAFVVPRAGTTPDTDELLDLLTQRVARFKVPRHIRIVAQDEIPTTASGRAQKFLLAQQAMRLLSL